MENKTNQICKCCGKDNAEDANFCECCGTKLNEVCPACWKKEGQPGSCPGEKCVEYAKFDKSHYDDGSIYAP